MNRTEVESFVKNEYATEPEFLWEGDKITAVFRHANHKKWFGILMRISSRKLGLNSDELVNVINVKLDPDFIQVLLRDKADQLFPAYHMNKKHWLTIILNQHTDAELVQALIHDSFANTL